MNANARRRSTYFHFEALRETVTFPTAVLLEEDGAEHVEARWWVYAHGEDLSPFVDREPDLFVACGVGDEKDGCGVRGAGAVEAVDELEQLFAGSTRSACSARWDTLGPRSPWISMSTSSRPRAVASRSASISSPRSAGSFAPEI